MAIDAKVLTHRQRFAASGVWRRLVIGDPAQIPAGGTSCAKCFGDRASQINVSRFARLYQLLEC